MSKLKTAAIVRYMTVPAGFKPWPYLILDVRITL